MNEMKCRDQEIIQVRGQGGGGILGAHETRFAMSIPKYKIFTRKCPSE